MERAAAGQSSLSWADRALHSARSGRNCNPAARFFRAAAHGGSILKDPMSNTTIAKASWYDQPACYDLAFRSETPSEADFIEAAYCKYCAFPARRLLEPACGTGRLIAELASRGHCMIGFDQNRAALTYLRRRLARRKLQAVVFSADMADFRLPEAPEMGPIDAAYNTFDSFRHLLDEQSARKHLEGVANCLRPGGIYVLGLHLLPPDAAEECIERWSARRGRAQVSVTLRVLDFDRRRRLERLRVSLLVRRANKKPLRLRDEFHLRLYTAAQFRRLLASVPQFELCDVYDFWYEIDRPLRLDNQISDTVFILRRRAKGA